jgi:hypothetical protein
MRKIIHALVILTPFIAVYAAHLGLIAIGVTARTAVGLMVLAMGLMAAALIVAVDMLRNEMKQHNEPAAHRLKSIPPKSDQ